MTSLERIEHYLTTHLTSRNWAPGSSQPYVHGVIIHLSRYGDQLRIGLWEPTANLYINLPKDMALRIYKAHHNGKEPLSMAKEFAYILGLNPDLSTEEITALVADIVADNVESAQRVIGGDSIWRHDWGIEHNGRQLLLSGHSNSICLRSHPYTEHLALDLSNDRITSMYQTYLNSPPNACDTIAEALEKEGGR